MEADDLSLVLLALGRGKVMRFFMRKDYDGFARLFFTDRSWSFDLKGSGGLINEKGMRGLEG